MEESKVVHFNLFRPENALFKQKGNQRSEIQIITCNNSENCQLLQRGECACRYGLYGGRCPYGSFSAIQGYTRRANKYHSWCNEQKKKYEGIRFLEPPKILGYVGDYVFLPYAHMNMLESLPWEGSFLPKEDFNSTNIIKLITFQPQALFGGEIKAYQKDIPPLFLKHLSEHTPELFDQVISESSYAADCFKEFSNLGREAILETLTPNIGRLKDIHGGLWEWDGKELHSENSRMSFGLCKFSKVSITPLEGQKIKITNESQVNKDTVFVG